LACGLVAPGKQAPPADIPQLVDRDSTMMRCRPAAPAQNSRLWFEVDGTKGLLHMDNITLIRIVAGVLFVIVLVVLVQRRRTRVK
jgi:hypothetical protein